MADYNSNKIYRRVGFPLTTENSDVFQPRFRYYNLDTANQLPINRTLCCNSSKEYKICVAIYIIIAALLASQSWLAYYLLSYTYITASADPEILKRGRQFINPALLDHKCTYRPMRFIPKRRLTEKIPRPVGETAAPPPAAPALLNSPLTIA